MTPAFRIVADGRDITAQINDRLLSLRTTDKPAWSRMNSSCASMTATAPWRCPGAARALKCSSVTPARS